MNALLTAHELSKRRFDAPDRHLFQGVTAALVQCQRTALIGVSGQGKTTLLRILACLEPADGGEILFRGIPRREWKPHDWRKHVCYVAQHPVMLPGTVEDNLQTVSRLSGKPFDRELATRCMEALGLASPYWAKPATELSGGEKQRVALVRSLLLRPEVLLLDEVTASLDPGSKKAVERLLNDWSQREGTASLWITHDLEQVKQVSDRVWFMAGGRLLEQEDTLTFFACPGTDEARRFIAWQESEMRPAGGKEEQPDV